MATVEKTLSGKTINTLVQTGTNNFQSPDKIVMGKGSDLADKKAWKGRAKRKKVSQALSVRLVAEAEKKGEPERKISYWNTFHCQERLIIQGGRSYGKYCKNRFCPLCNSIRKAEIINKYLPVIRTWENPYFVTLTQKAVPAEKLALWFSGVHKAFQQIKGMCKKRYQRGTGPQFIGIKSLECNFNPKKKTYNPHLHLIVPNREMAVLLIAEWQKKWTAQYSSPSAQHMRRVKNVETDLIETIKYGSKIFTDFDAQKKGADKKIYVAALDNIYKAMEPYRIFDRFGFNLPATEKTGMKKSVPVNECDDFIYAVEVSDWINTKTGEGLTGYRSTAELEYLLTENVDTEMQ